MKKLLVFLLTIFFINSAYADDEVCNKRVIYINPDNFWDGIYLYSHSLVWKVTSNSWKRILWPSNYWVSPDWKNQAFVLEKDNKKVVVLNWVEGKYYNYINEETLKFSYDSKHLVYFLWLNSDEKWAWLSKWKDTITWDEKTLVFDWKEIYNVNSIIFSANWSYAYTKTENNKNIIVKDDTIIENAYNPIFSNDWNEFSYISEKDWNKKVVKNWIEDDIYDNVYSLKYYEDWKTFAYIWIKDNKEYFVEYSCGQKEIIKDIKYNLFSNQLKEFITHSLNNKIKYDDWIEWLSDESLKLFINLNQEDLNELANHGWGLSMASNEDIEDIKNVLLLFANTLNKKMINKKDVLFLSQWQTSDVFLKGILMILIISNYKDSYHSKEYNASINKINKFIKDFNNLKLHWWKYITTIIYQNWINYKLYWTSKWYVIKQILNK